MSWLFGGEATAADLKRRTPSGAPAPELCKTCHTLLSKCRCAQRIVTAPDGKKMCGVCSCEFDACKCAAEWGRREMARRAALEPQVLVSNMCAMLADTTEQLVTKSNDIFKTLSEHGALLLKQHVLLTKHDGKGVLTEGLLMRHAEAVAEWMAACDRELERAMRRADFPKSTAPPHQAAPPAARSIKRPVP
jgi:hypothetical protein